MLRIGDGGRNVGLECVLGFITVPSLAVSSSSSALSSSRSDTAEPKEADPVGAGSDGTVNGDANADTIDCDRSDNSKEARF
jgi:hypothetical protein